MDVTSSALLAIGRGNAYAPVLAFAAGLAGSFGPCAASRLVAVAACGSNKSLRESAFAAGSFVAGLVLAYLLFALAGSLIWEAFRYSGEIYAIAAVFLAAGGLAAVIRAPAECVHSQVHWRRSSGSMFLLGASSALMVSPCCTPIVLASIAYAGVTGLWFSCAAIACFALGHAFPVALVAIGGSVLRPLLTHPNVQGATSMIGGSLLLGLAGYYVVVA
ncbi:MAG TPA: cytochrome c biogenesis protein CcdA [Candidatus Rubrimentiphilum sp.]|nr:cytochrome c biogenesis protein CcdA [Candidatus Rubrimentiphilum sp.]